MRADSHESPAALAIGAPDGYEPFAASQELGEDLAHRTVSIAIMGALSWRRRVMQISTTRSKQTWRKRMTAGQRWHPFAHRDSLQRSFRLVRVRLAVSARRQTWMAIGAAVGHASSHRWSQARTKVRYGRRGRRQELMSAGSTPEDSSATQTTLKASERNTLEIGAGVVLSVLGLGFQYGRWPAWTALVAGGGYVTWVALYAEATVQARRHRTGRSTRATPEATSGASTP